HQHYTRHYLFLRSRHPPSSPLFPYTTLFRSPACVNRKMLSMNRSTSLFSASRKYSATVSPLSATRSRAPGGSVIWPYTSAARDRSEEHTSELQSRGHLVCRLLLEKKSIRSQE